METVVTKKKTWKYIVLPIIAVLLILIAAGAYYLFGSYSLY